MIDPTSKRHRTAIIEEGAKVGARTKIMEFAIIRAGVEIGEDCEVMERVTLGALPVNYSDFKRKPVKFGIKIGDRVMFHTSATVVSGITRATRIADDCIFGQQVTIGHDSQIGKSVLVNNHSTLGGFTEVGDNCRIHLNVTIRERLIIGRNTVIGMGSNVTKNIPSNRIAYGNPCRVIRLRDPTLKYLGRRARDGIRSRVKG